MLLKNKPEIERIVLRFHLATSKRLRKKYFKQLLRKLDRVPIIHINEKMILVKPELYYGFKEWEKESVH